MAINTLGLSQGLAQAGQDYNSSYMNALGTAYSRNLAQQKQASETNLQNAQAGYFSGRNASQQSVATIRANAVNEAGQTRANGALEAARVNALQKLPGSFNTLAAQDPAAAGDYLKSVDAMNGGQTSFFKDLFPNRYAAEQGASGQGAAGGPGQPYTDPTDGSIKFGAPPSAPSVSPILPPSGSIGGAPSAGVQGVSPMSFSAPGVGLSGMGLNAPPSSLITGVSPALPPPSGLLGASSLGNTSAAPSPSLPSPSLPSPSLGSGALPTLPPSGPLGNTSPGQMPPAPSLGSGISPTLLPSSGPIGALGADANPFSLSPLTVSQINKNNAGANGTLSKTDMAFQNSVGLLPPAQQAQATARFNQINGTNYAVPGTQTFPTLANGTPALGPPSVTQPYAPNALQASTIAGKNAQTSAIGENYGLKVQQFKSLQDYQQALVVAKQQEIGLQRQGLSEKTAHDSVMANIAQQGLNARGSGFGGSGVAGDGLTLRINQRLTALTTPGKLNLMGKPSSPPLVTLDAQGNPTGPGAAEYQSLQGMMRSRAGGTVPANPVGGGYHLIPGVGSSVQGVSGPSVPALPGFPSRQPAASGSGAYNGPIPNSQADFQRMTPQQKYDYKNIYLRGLNAGR